MDPGASWRLPSALGPATVRTVFGFVGNGFDIGGHAIGPDTAAVVRCDEPVVLTAGDEAVEILLLQGRPIGEPVERYGPFVMNDRAGIETAFADYRRTGFGGWPWPTDDPVHDRAEARFARHADGTVDRVTETVAP